MVSLSTLKPKMVFPKEYTDAETKKAADLIGKTITIKAAMPYTKEGVEKAAMLIDLEGKTYSVFTQGVAIVEIVHAIAEMGDEFDGVKVKIVGKVSKSGRAYVDFEEVE